MKKLTHFDEHGAARMVDVGAKRETAREAIAEGRISLQPETLALVLAGKTAKGDVLGVARVAGIMAAKKTSDLIPLCHPLALASVTIDFEPEVNTSSVLIRATVRLDGKTGVEMEALTAVAVAGLTIYDMCKAVDRGMVLSEIRLMRKSGGASGTFQRDELRP